MQMVEHHTHYKEIHGYDATISMTKSQHSKINHRLLFPEISAEELAEISKKAVHRTNKAKERQAQYQSQNKNKISKRRKKHYQNNRNKLLAEKRQYRIDNIDLINRYRKRLYYKYYTTVYGQNTVFMETVIYNIISGCVSYSAGFYGHHAHKLPKITIES